MVVALVALVLIFGIPLSAILGSTYLKAKRLELEAGGGNAAESTRRLARLEAENTELRRRIEVLETIVTSDEGPARARVRVTAAANVPHDEAARVEPAEPAAQRSVRG